MKLKKHLETETYELPTHGGGKYTTDIPPKERSFKNQPKYANGKSKVKFQDWLLIKSQKRDPKHSAYSFGKSDADGKWYGWSHRAVAGFGAGDKVTGDNSAKKQSPEKNDDGTTNWDTGYEPDFTIKDDDHAREVAMQFSDNVG